MLEAPEYLQLAIHASHENQHHTALDYLNKALELEPGHAGVRYFLAAEYAELGLFPRAARCMAEALELDPGMDLARFQLGLLHLQLQEPEQARATFETLFSVSTDDSLRAFADAYLSLFNDDQQNAIGKFEAGLAICENAALKGDMIRVLATLTPSETQPLADGLPSETSTPVFLGAYRDVVEAP